MTRDYDSTLARMAGNIAPALVSKMREPKDLMSADAREGLAQICVQLARDIITQCQKAQKEQEKV